MVKCERNINQRGNVSKTKRLILYDNSVPWYRSGGAPAPVAVWQAKGAASLAASLVNLVSPGVHDLTAGAATTLQAAGWLGDGTAYLVSDIVPSLTYSMIVRFSGQNDSIRTLMGVLSSTTQRFYLRNVGGGNMTFENGNGSFAGSYQATAVYGMAGKTTFINGVQQTSVSSAGTDPTHPIFVMGLNNIGSVSQRLSQGNVQATAVWASTLSPAQMTAISNTLATL